MSLNKIINTKGKAKLAVLIDPDKFNEDLIRLSEKSKVAFFLVGGSKLKKNNLDAVIRAIKRRSIKPILLFPGDETQLSKNADGMLLLSLISGRNPEYLIGKHVKASKKIRAAKIQTLSTGYILIEGQKISSTQKITKTKALSTKNLDLIVSTAMAGEMLGLKAIYLEAGSGAKEAIQAGIIRHVKASIALPLLVGGGIESYEKAKKAVDAGANVVVIGNSLEKNINLLSEIEKAFL